MYKKLLLLTFFATLPSTSYGNIFHSVNVQNLDIEYIEYPVGSEIYDIKVGISEQEQDLSAISKDYGAISGINGVFFCPADYPQCKGKNYTINERFLDGKDLSFYQDTGERGVFGWDTSGLPYLYQTGKINQDKRENIFEGMGNFPILYSDGVSMLEHYHDIGLYDLKMRASLPRHFICSNKENTEIFFGRSSPTSLDNLAPALYKLGCWNGINLDAGNSAHLNYNGAELVKGQRPVIDGFFIIHKYLNIHEIESNINTVINLLESKYLSLRKDTALNSISHGIKFIHSKKAKIEAKYTIETDTGFTTEITNLDDLQTVYTLSALEREFKKLYREISNSGLLK